MNTSLEGKDTALISVLQGHFRRTQFSKGQAYLFIYNSFMQNKDNQL
jgi:hypothetical protein